MPSVIVGPWLGEVGHELLYWIPYLRKQVEESGFAPADATIISRGGVADWYRGIGEKYNEVFDYISTEVFRAQNESRRKRTGWMKQKVRSEFDGILVDAMDYGEFPDVHPGEMFRMFEACWRGEESIQHILDRTVHQKIEMRRPYRTSSRYAAIKFYWSQCFPETSENRRFMNSLTAGLRKEYGEVIFLTGIAEADEHSDCIPDGVRCLARARPSTNLLMQGEYLAGASAFYGTYGGFSYLAPYLGVPSYSFYSERNFLPVHLEVAREVFRALGVEFEATEV